MSDVKGSTCGMPSYAIVQSYIHCTEVDNPWRQNCSPRLRGSNVCFKSGIPDLLDHFALALRPFLDMFVPSGKSSSHIGSRVRMSARYFILSRKCTSSASHRRDKKIQEKNVNPGPMIGIFFNESLSMTKR